MFSKVALACFILANFDRHCHVKRSIRIFKCITKSWKL